MVNLLTSQLKFLAFLGIVPFSPGAYHQYLQKRFTLLAMAIDIAITGYTLGFIKVPHELKISIWLCGTVFLALNLTCLTILTESLFTYNAHFSYLTKSRNLKLLMCRELQLVIGKLPRRYVYHYILLGIFAYGGIASTTAIIVGMAYNYFYYWYALGAILVMRTRCLLLTLYIDYIGYYLESYALKLRAVVNWRFDGDQTFLDVNYKRLLSLEYLLNLKQVYNGIYKLSLAFNDYYGWSLLSIMIVTFLDIIMNVYLAFLTLADVYPIELFYLACTSIIPLLIQTFKLCASCENCKTQHNLIAGYVRRLSSTSKEVKDLRIYNDLLDEFSVQLQQDRIVITAKGFINLDFQLLTSMFTAMAAYVTILMQFRISGKEYVQRQMT